MYCTQYEIYRNSYEHLKKHGEVQEIYKPVQDMTGEIIDRQFQGFKRNPMTQIYSDAIKNLTKIGSELGLSPKSRSELMELNMQTTKMKMMEWGISSMKIDLTQTHDVIGTYHSLNYEDIREEFKTLLQNMLLMS
ncbi:hypothetical protein N42HA_01397 [Lactococcus lactis]|nr:hypothetical protein [Lactococcus lactis]